MNIIVNINIPTAVEIHIGDKTHHQDQSILSNNFNIINTIVNTPTNPIPPLLVLLSPILFYLLLIIYLIS